MCLRKLRSHDCLYPSFKDLAGSDVRCFLAAWAVSTSFKNVRQKPNLPTWKGNPSPRCSALAYYSANAFFVAGRCAPVRAHRQQVPKASSLAADKDLAIPVLFDYSSYIYMQVPIHSSLFLIFFIHSLTFFIH